MNTSKTTADEIEAAEKAKDERTQSRRRGFDKMKERDQNYAFIRDYNTSSPILVRWGEYPGKFIIGAKNRQKDLVFDAEELRKWLRWA